MSMQASGAFAGTMVFANRKGVNVVRQLVIPANPMSLNQETARNRVRTTGATQSQTNLTTEKGEGRLTTDKANLIAATPPGQTWNSYFVNLQIGAGALTYDAALAAYALLTAPQKAAWVAAADALTPAMPAVAQKTTGGAASTPLTSGQAFFIAQYGLASGGLASAPTGTPPVYA